MSIERIKKEAKNLQRLLPEFLASNTPPFKLTAVQKLVCQAKGFANMELACAALERNDDDATDPIGAFYRYPWTDIDPSDVVASVKGRTGTQVAVSVVDVETAPAWLKKHSERASKSGPPQLTVIISAGAAGRELLDLLLEADSRQPAQRWLTKAYAMVSFSTLSQRVGITMNWLSNWSNEDIRGALKSMVKPVCSDRQFAACSSAIDIIVEQVDLDADSHSEDDTPVFGEPPARITAEALSSKLQALLALSEGGWDKDSYEGFSGEFEDGPEDAMGKLFESCGGEDLRPSTRPLEALLTRLAALGDGEGHQSALGWRSSADNLEFESLGGLRLVLVDMESKRLDHVMAMAALAKFAATAQDRYQTPGDARPMEVLLVT